MCINFANENLQQFFVQHIFKLEQARFFPVKMTHFRFYGYWRYRASVAFQNTTRPKFVELEIFLIDEIKLNVQRFVVLRTRCWLSKDDQSVSHNDLRPSVGSLLNPHPHNGVYASVYSSTQNRRVCKCVFAVSNLCPVYCSSSHTTSPVHNTGRPSSPTHTGWGPVNYWSRVPTGTVVEQIASFVHSLFETKSKPAFLVGIWSRRSIFGPHAQMRTASSNRPRLNRQTGPISSGVTMNPRTPAQISKESPFSSVKGTGSPSNSTLPSHSTSLPSLLSVSTLLLLAG